MTTLNANTLSKTTEHITNNLLLSDSDSSITASMLDLNTQGWTLLEDVDSAADAESALLNFGALLPQFDGEIRYDVKNRPDKSQFQWSGSMHRITPHTEHPARETPPKYLALYCVNPSKNGDGHTVVYDGYDFLNSLPPDLKAYATTKAVEFAVRTDPEGQPTESFNSPLLTLGLVSNPILRFSYNMLWYGVIYPRADLLSNKNYKPEHCSEELAEICKYCIEYCENNMKRVLIPKNGLLVWDNRRMLHSREQFTDPDRHLIRYFIG